MENQENKSAKIVTCFNSKGGCGKTTTAVQLAGTLGKMGYKVFLCDMDPQNTATLWYHTASAEHPFNAEAMALGPLKETFVSKLAPLTKKFDLIVIDCPPALESRVPWVSLLASDLAIIPVIPVMDNIWTAKQAQEFAEKAELENPSLKAAFLLNMKRRGKVYEVCENELRELARLPFFKTEIAMRNAFPESQLYGAVVSDFGKSKASEEVEMLAKEVLEMVGLKTKRGGK